MALRICAELMQTQGGISNIGADRRTPNADALGQGLSLYTVVTQTGGPHNACRAIKQKIESGGVANLKLDKF